VQSPAAVTFTQRRHFPQIVTSYERIDAGGRHRTDTPGESARRLRAQCVQHGIGQGEVIEGAVNAYVVTDMSHQVAEH
jgi:hypothetical protein